MTKQCIYDNFTLLNSSAVKGILPQKDARRLVGRDISPSIKKHFVRELIMSNSKTKMIKHKETEHDWYIIDVADKVLGRAATEIAVLIMGKNRPDFTPHVDNGAGVVVLNCNKVKVTGNKKIQKIYKSFSGYPGGLKETTYEKMIEKKPKHILKHAVKGMLPKNKLGARMIKRLKLYVGEEHPHTAQNPKEYKV